MLITETIRNTIVKVIRDNQRGRDLTPAEMQYPYNLMQFGKDAADLIKDLQTQVEDLKTVLSDGIDPPVWWTGYYTRIDARQPRRWYWCEVVAHDRGKVVIRTMKGHYSAKELDLFCFAKEVPPGETKNDSPPPTVEFVKRR